MSNISLSNDDGSTTYEFPNSYYLVDATNAASLNIDLEDVPNGDYTKVNFMIGVDSTRNVSGAQEGALDVANGMFWSWNMGYIFMKMEGTVQDSIDFRYHIGGFNWNANNIKIFYGENAFINIKTEPFICKFITNTSIYLSYEKIYLE